LYFYIIIIVFKIGVFNFQKETIKVKRKGDDKVSEWACVGLFSIIITIIITIILLKASILKNFEGLKLLNF